MVAPATTSYDVRARPPLEAEVLLSAEEHPERPAAGSIIGGTVALVADLEEPRPRRWFRRG